MRLPLCLLLLVAVSAGKAKQKVQDSEDVADVKEIVEVEEVEEVEEATSREGATDVRRHAILGNRRARGAQRSAPILRPPIQQPRSVRLVGLAGTSRAQPRTNFFGTGSFPLSFPAYGQAAPRPSTPQFAAAPSVSASQQSLPLAGTSISALSFGQSTSAGYNPFGVLGVQGYPAAYPSSSNGQSGVFPAGYPSSGSLPANFNLPAGASFNFPPASSSAGSFQTLPAGYTFPSQLGQFPGSTVSGSYPASSYPGSSFPGSSFPSSSFPGSSFPSSSFPGSSFPGSFPGSTVFQNPTTTTLGSAVGPSLPTSLIPRSPSFVLPSSNSVPVESIFTQKKNAPCETPPDSDLLMLRAQDVPDAINKPKYVSVQAAQTFLVDGDAVIGLLIDGQAKAFPLLALESAHLVNDDTFALTYSPLSGSGIPVLLAHFGNQPLRESGVAYENNLLFTSNTDTMYSQMLQKGLRGVNTCKTFSYLPAIETTWGSWRKLHPQTTVMELENMVRVSPWADYARSTEIALPSSFDSFAEPFRRFHAKERVLNVPWGTDNLIFPLPEIDAVGGVFNDERLQAVIALDATARVSAVFDSKLPGGRRGSFSLAGRDDDGFIVLAEHTTNSEFDLRGVGISGSLKGTRLTQLPFYESYWFAASALFPKTDVFDAAKTRTTVVNGRAVVSYDGTQGQPLVIVGGGVVPGTITGGGTITGSGQVAGVTITKGVTVSKQGSCCAASDQQEARVGCDDKTVEQCVCEKDAFCCLGHWDQGCVKRAAKRCDAGCALESSCCSVSPGQLGCVDFAVTQCVCDDDPFCCLIQWDHNCQLRAARSCGAQCR